MLSSAPVARYLLRYKGERVLLAPGSFTLGRAVDSGLHLDDVEVSRTHAVLHVEHDGIEIEDMGSRNGIYLNGNRVKGRVVIKHGDRVDIGTQQIEIIEEEERHRRAAMTTVNTPDASERLRDELRRSGHTDELPKELEQLSPRELEVLKQVAHGHTHKEVAERLRVSVKTVETYRARIATKLGLRSRAELVKYAIDAGLLTNV